MTPIQAAFAVARQGHRPPLPPRTPPRLAQLIQLCWHDDPIRRPTFSQVVAGLKEVRREVYAGRQGGGAGSGAGAGGGGGEKASLPPPRPAPVSRGRGEEGEGERQDAQRRRAAHTRQRGDPAR
ncbi:serine threonine protein kinase [Nannochloropsis gaditana]|uniref:Serine threonine protein kinase n=1 Tax=Nannochloropsis gaditana TaxID=72520 RepID=W7TCY9_9STRA|nr:serine threonine protein kinase [Nannochloropsis gaditana]